MLARRQLTEEISLSRGPSSTNIQKNSQLAKRPLDACSTSSDFIHEDVFSTSDESTEGSYRESSSNSRSSEVGCAKPSSMACKKKQRGTQLSQLSLKSFFQKKLGGSGNSNSILSDK